MNVEILRQEGASCIEGFIARGGKLQLTKASISFDFKEDERFDSFSIELNDIDKVDYFRTLSIIPNGLTLFLKSGDMTHFVVDDRKAWKEAIAKAKKAKAV